MINDVEGVGKLIVTGSVTSGTDLLLPESGIGSYHDQTFNGLPNDAIILQFDDNSGVLDWGTLYGGSGTDLGINVAVDIANDNYYVTGGTLSEDFPLLSQNPSGLYSQENIGSSGFGDGFILRFNALNQRTWTSYFGGDNSDVGRAMALFQSSKLYLTGEAFTTDPSSFPINNDLGSDAYYQTNNPSHTGFVSRFDLNPLVGISETKGPHEMFLLYPNPSNGLVRFGNNNEHYLNIQEVKIYNSMGRLIKQYHSLASSSILDLSFLQSGFYTVAIYQDNTLYREKIVIQ